MPDSQHEFPDPHPAAPAPSPGGTDPRPASTALQADRLAAPRATHGAQAEEPDPDTDETQSSSRLHLVVGSLIGAAVIIAILLGVLTQAKGARLEPGKPVPGAERTMRLLAGIPQHGFTLGRPHAPLTLTEFCDLQSSGCAAFSKEGLPSVISRYVRPGRLRIVFRPVALVGGESTRAAQMAAALAQQDRLWQFVDLMYRNQGHEGSAYVTETYLAALTTAIPGARLASAVQARESTRVKAELAQASARARALRLSATPAFLLARTGGGTPQRVAASRILEPAAFSATIAGLKR